MAQAGPLSRNVVYNIVEGFGCRSNGRVELTPATVPKVAVGFNCCSVQLQFWAPGPCASSGALPSLSPGTGQVRILTMLQSALGRIPLRHSFFTTAATEQPTPLRCEVNCLW